jgi:hypothetical protein
MLQYRSFDAASYKGKLKVTSKGFDARTSRT